MTNPKPNSAANSHRPVTPVVMAASIIVGLSGAVQSGTGADAQVGQPLYRYPTFLLNVLL
jgi:hypothetical protein